MGEIVIYGQVARQANDDDHLLQLFLNRQDSDNTKATYKKAIGQFLDSLRGLPVYNERIVSKSFVEERRKDGEAISHKPLRTVTIDDIQMYRGELNEAYDSAFTRRVKFDAVRSLFSYATKIGYMQFNVAAAEKPIKVKNELAERILTEEQVLKMINAPDEERDRTVLRLLYSAGLRVSELCDLAWRHIHGCTLTIHGKGEKTRHIVISEKTCSQLVAFRPDHASPEDFMFLTIRGNRLDPSTVFRIVRKAAMAAGITEDVSPHWLRHSHASHALERGANVAKVKETLGHGDVAVTSKYLHIKPEDSSSLYLIV